MALFTFTMMIRKRMYWASCYKWVPEDIYQKSSLPLYRFKNNGVYLQGGLWEIFS